MSHFGILIQWFFCVTHCFSAVSCFGGVLVLHLPNTNDMKTDALYKKLLLILMIIFVSVTGIYAQAKTSYSLVKLNGKVLSDGTVLSNAVVLLYEDNSMVDNKETSVSGDFSFIMSAGKDYKLLIDKQGFERRVIRINSSMLSRIDKLKYFEFTIDLDRVEDDQLADK